MLFIHPLFWSLQIKLFTMNLPTDFCVKISFHFFRVNVQEKDMTAECLTLQKTGKLS